MPELELSERNSLISQLLENHAEFRRLHKTHQSLDGDLQKLDEQRHLTNEQEVERKKIQKLKLQQKDRMEQILRTFTSRESSVA